MKRQKGFAVSARRALVGLLKTVARWQALYREREVLAQLSDAALRDIGLNRADVDRQSPRHLWDDPLRK